MTSTFTYENVTVNVISALLTIPQSLALTVSATPVVRDAPLVSLPFVKHINATGTVNLLAQDQARARWLKARAKGEPIEERAGSVPVTNELVSYLAAVGVGSPATTCEWLSITLCGNSADRSLSARQPHRRHGQLQHVGRQHQVQANFDCQVDIE